MRPHLTLLRFLLAVAGLAWLGAAAGAQNAPPPAGNLTPEQLQQLVAPIALYPDSVVAQLLAASTFPDQVQAAQQAMTANAGLNARALADAINAQTWDPSVKALCEYPTALTLLSSNLQWTSELGDAYYNQSDDVMDAVQGMRRRAWDAGILRSTAQQTVSRAADGTITITPANAGVVYLPTYDPWLCFGPAFTPWYPWVFPPGWSVGVGLRFGAGFNLGFWTGFPWALPVWGFDWGGHHIIYGHAPYVVRSPVMVNHFIVHPAPAGSMRAGAPRPAPRAPGREAAPQARATAPPAAREPANPKVSRGFTPPPARSAPGTRTSAFSGIGHGGVAAGNAFHGGASMAAPRAPAGGRGREEL